ncbi:hypothetical protein VW23_027465 [Devosia insulae DS-56]|uniref:Uncharacterized protein n=1 Tax=Devosia insulae DS-56 TaxID=1116389 RepID=A0A1E5XK71_9HYPH|nr:hypothetical protein [Devosia insulae]OEO28987.1 hypothetical protein VW23_027465 [Devosia insulae DS-56]
MQIHKSRFNAVGWWGLIFFVAALPALAGVYKLVQDSNESQLNILEVTGSNPASTPNLLEVSPWVLVVTGAVMLLGIVMMIVGKNSYVHEVGE